MIGVQNVSAVLKMIFKWALFYTLLFLIKDILILMHRNLDYLNDLLFHIGTYSH